jgi:hypothetical protein
MRCGPWFRFLYRRRFPLWNCRNFFTLYNYRGDLKSVNLLANIKALKGHSQEIFDCRLFSSIHPNYRSLINGLKHFRFRIRRDICLGSPHCQWHYWNRKWAQGKSLSTYRCTCHGDISYEIFLRIFPLKEDTDEQSRFEISTMYR